MWMALIILVAGCADDDIREALDELGGGPAVCEGGPEAPVYTIESVSSIGPAANVLAEYEDTLWIVESQQNTVSTWRPQNGVEQAVDVGENANPYDVLVVGSRVFVSNYLAGNVQQYDRSGNLVQTFEGSLVNPAGLAWDGSRLWVTDINYISPEEGFGTARLEIFDEDGSSLATVELDAENLQYASTEVVDGQPWVFAVATGAIDFVDGVALATSAARVYRWPADVAIEDLDSYQVASLEVDQPVLDAAIGRITRKPGTNLAYFASATAPHTFVLDLAQMQWLRGLEDPIELYETSENALHHAAFDEREILYVTAFNDDALYMVDTRCDEVLQRVDIGISEELLEGPHGVIARENEAFFVMSLANSLGRVRFEW